MQSVRNLPEPRRCVTCINDESSTKKLIFGFAIRLFSFSLIIAHGCFPPQALGGLLFTIAFQFHPFQDGGNLQILSGHSIF
jgi:hypothetical protein